MEREVRQLLADKVSGNLLGLWLLVPEHLRLGTWDLLRTWSGELAHDALPARLALHLVHEAALCRPTLRTDRSLRHRGFELANGLPWLPTDGALHDLLEAHTVEQAQQLQIGLGQTAPGQRPFPWPGPGTGSSPPGQLLQTGYAAASSQRHRAGHQASPNLLPLGCQNPPTPLSGQRQQRSRPELRHAGTAPTGPANPAPPDGQRPLIVADVEHFTVELLDYVRQHTPFDLLVPLRHTVALQKHYRALPQEAFVRHWAGFAIATETFQPRRTALAVPCYRYIQRTGERPEDYHFKGFICTQARSEVSALTAAFPERWHIEEFFRFDQHLGWKRAGTLNLHIRLGQMTLALLAQGLIHQLRQRLGAPFNQWDAVHFARDLFSGLEGDLRVHQDTVLVTYYNAPQAHQWKQHFENLPQRLQKEGVDPRVPWLYNFKLDFRFK